MKEQLVEVEGSRGHAFALLTTDARRFQMLKLWEEIRGLPAIDARGNARLSLDYLLVQGLRLLRDQIKGTGDAMEPEFGMCGVRMKQKAGLEG